MTKPRDKKPILNGLAKDGVTDDENPEWTADDFRAAKSFSSLPTHTQQLLKAASTRGRPHSESPKEMISFRLPAELIAAIKSSGRGYGKRVESILQDAMERKKL